MSLERNSGLARVEPLRTRRRLRPQSRKRQRANRQRRRVAEAKYGTDPQCEFPGCADYADDVHEPLTRARGGSITDPENMVACCRQHHSWVHAHPREAAELGLLLPSRPDGGAA